MRNFFLTFLFVSHAVISGRNPYFDIGVSPILSTDEIKIVVDQKLNSLEPSKTLIDKRLHTSIRAAFEEIMERRRNLLIQYEGFNIFESLEMIGKIGVSLLLFKLCYSPFITFYEKLLPVLILLAIFYHPLYLCFYHYFQTEGYFMTFIWFSSVLLVKLYLRVLGKKEHVVGNVVKISSEESFQIKRN